MTTPTPRVPRTTSAILAVLVVLVGLGGRAVLPESVGGPLGDALYATLLVLLVALVRPRTRPVVAAGVALVVCAAIELSHLTGVPATVLDRFPLARFVLGTTFGAQDLAWYALGATVGGALLALAAPRARDVDRSLRHVRARGGRRGALIAVPLVLVAVLAVAGGVAWTLRAESRDLAAHLTVAQSALDGSADRVADEAVRAELAAAIDHAGAVLAGRPLLDRLPGDAAAARERLEQEVAGVNESRLTFARAQVVESRDALEPIAGRAEQVLTAADELDAEGRGADEAVRSALRTAVETAGDVVAAAGDDLLEAAGLAEVEATAASLTAGADELESATTELMTAQDAVVCPEADQVWFPEAGNLAEKKLAPIPWAPQYSVRADVLDGLVALDEAYRAEFGQHLTVNSAYRSYDQQVEVYNPDDPNPLAAPPGCSNHGLGTAVDISMGPEGFDGARYAWLKKHAEPFGWAHPGWAEPDGRLPEPWHWQSVETPTEY